MHTKRNRRLSICSLVTGYLFLFTFVLLIILQEHHEGNPVSADVSPSPASLAITVADTEPDAPLFVPLVPVIERTIAPAYLDPQLHEVFSTDSVVVDRASLTVVGDGARDRVYHRHNRDIVEPRGHFRDLEGALIVDTAVDRGILERRLFEDNELLVSSEDQDFPITEALRPDNIGLERGGNDNIDATRFELDEGAGDEADLGDVGDFEKDGSGEGRGSLPGVGEGSQVYAYSFPSQGVGAGIGSAGVGAAAGYAGIGAGIGQAILNGAAVATLGGIGTSPISTSNLEPTPENDQDGDGIPTLTERELGTDPSKADTDGDGVNDGAELEAYSNPLSASSTPSSPGSVPLAQLGGVGGLSNGAGAGAAAGLATSKVKLGLGMKLDTGVGAGEGIGSAQGVCSLDHLPPNGSLHIMMHVDGSGSILDTRKQLTIMKDTLLKDALLPYYNNNEDLYNRRVSIVSSSDERSLKFYTLAAKKANVLAVAFQDEACPVYHLPTFNKGPAKHYLDDLGKLKASLNGYGGLYRGIIFQVNRGRTFSKSFKEFVECSWRGEGYLEAANLKKYYRDNNNHHIKNKDGVVFSDEYRTESEGDPQYYLDLIFKAAQRIGLDLDIYRGGLVDGKHYKEQ